MTTATKKKIAAETLKALARTADRPVDEKGNLDIEAFNRLPEVQKAINKFKAMGITREWLRKHGFLVAHIVLTF
jgi:hypothetical protein